MSTQNKLRVRAQELKRVLLNVGVSRLIVFGFFILLLCLTSAQDFPSTITNILTRVGMHGVLVLCMVPSIRAGLGPNFAVPFGVLAGLLGALIPIEMNMSGFPAFFLSIALAILFSLPFGLLFGYLMNRVRGSEMMIATYFGYAMVYILCIAWLLLPFQNDAITMSMGAGLRNTINLEPYFGEVLDSVLAVNVEFSAGQTLFLPVWSWVIWAVAVFCAYFFLIRSTPLDIENISKAERAAAEVKNRRARIAGTVIVVLVSAFTLLVTFGGSLVRPLHDALSVDLTFKSDTSLQVPTGTLLFLLLLCFLMWLYNKSRSGIAMYAAGTNPSYAAACGVNISRQRMKGAVLSIMLAAIGIVVYAQSYGFLQLYSAPLNMCFPPVAAILIGGASISDAKISHVLIGVLLFQGVLTMGPTIASRYLAGISADVDPTEIVRIIITNGIILYALTKARRASGEH